MIFQDGDRLCDHVRVKEVAGLGRGLLPLSDNQQDQERLIEFTRSILGLNGLESQRAARRAFEDAHQIEQEQ